MCTDLALYAAAPLKLLKVECCCLQLPSQQRLKASRRSHTPRGAPSERRPAAQTLPDKRHPPKTPRTSGHVLSGPTTLVAMQQRDDPVPAIDESEQGQQRAMELTRSASRGSMKRIVRQVPSSKSTHTCILLHVLQELATWRQQNHSTCCDCPQSCIQSTVRAFLCCIVKHQIRSARMIACGDGTCKTVGHEKCI
jgi:hypothetical protein